MLVSNNTLIDLAKFLYKNSKIQSVFLFKKVFYLSGKNCINKNLRVLINKLHFFIF